MKENTVQPPTPTEAFPPKVEIIIPTYNRAATLPHAIESALASSYERLSVLVVDDGSTDPTGALLARYEGSPRVRIVRHPKNRGATAAKNTGINHLAPDAKYFGILDSDDVLTENGVALLVERFEALGGAASQVFGWCADMHTGERTGHFRAERGPVTYRDVLSGTFRGEFWQLVRADVVGSHRFEERAAGGSEAILWHRLIKLAPADLIPAVVRLYDRSGSDRVSLDAYDPATARRKMWVYLGYLRAFGDDLRRECPEVYRDHALEAAKWAALAGERALGFRLAAGALSPGHARRLCSVTLQLLAPAALNRYIRGRRRPHPAVAASPRAKREARG